MRYITTAALVNELAEAADDKRLTRLVARYASLDLLVLDEVGYVSLDPKGAELLFQIITAREERASIACASNAPFSEWGNTFTDPRHAAAVVDRLTFNAHIITTGTRLLPAALDPSREEGSHHDLNTHDGTRPTRPHHESTRGLGPEQTITVGPNQLVIPISWSPTPPPPEAAMIHSRVDASRAPTASLRERYRAP